MNSFPLVLLLTLVFTALSSHAQSARDIRKAYEAHLRAEAHLADLRYDKAIAEWTRAMQLEPTNADWVFNRGIAKSKAKDFMAAIADFTAAINLKPDASSYYIERGFARFHASILSNATVDLDKAVALGRDANAYLSRARLYIGIGNRENALADADMAVRLDPNHPSAYFYRGAIRHALDDFPGAVSDYRRAVAVNPNEHYAQFFLFLALRLAGEDGFAELARATSKWPEGWDRSIGLYLIDSITETDFLSRAEQGTPSQRHNQLAEAHFYVGMVALIGRNSTKASRHLKKSIDQNVRLFLEDLVGRAELKRLRDLEEDDD